MHLFLQCFHVNLLFLHFFFVRFSFVVRFSSRPKRTACWVGFFCACFSLRYIFRKLKVADYCSGNVLEESFLVSGFDGTNDKKKGNEPYREINDSGCTTLGTSFGGLYIFAKKLTLRRPRRIQPRPGSRASSFHRFFVRSRMK